MSCTERTDSYPSTLAYGEAGKRVLEFQAKFSEDFEI